MIALLYMFWYTLFVVGNVVVLGWIGGRETGVRGGVRVLGELCVLLSVLGLLGVMWAWLQWMRQDQDTRR